MAASFWGSRISSFHNPKPLNSSASTNFKTHLTISSLPCHHFFRPNNNSKPLKYTRVGVSYQKWEAKKKPFRMPIVSCLVEDTPENFPESGSNDSSGALFEENNTTALLGMMLRPLSVKRTTGSLLTRRYIPPS